MRPNIDDDSILFRCRCSADHFLEVSQETDGDSLWVHFIDRPQSAIVALRRWWKQRSVLWADVGLTRDDVVALRDTLNEWLDRRSEPTP